MMGLWEGAEFIKTMRFVKFLSDHPPSWGKPMCYVELRAPLMRTNCEAKGTGGGQKARRFSTSGWPPTAEAPVGWSSTVSLNPLPVP